MKNKKIAFHFEGFFKITGKAGICPICEHRLLAKFFGKIEYDHVWNEPITGIKVDCETEPDFPSKNWDIWHLSHNGDCSKWLEREHEIHKWLYDIYVFEFNGIWYLSNPNILFAREMIPVTFYINKSDLIEGGYKKPFSPILPSNFIINQSL